MKKLLYFLLLFPIITYSQNRDVFNLDIARELGVCFDELTPIEDDPEYYYPLCSDSGVRVFYLEPNYYCVYTDAIGYCGSCGCQMDLYRKDNDIYKDIGSIFCIGVDINQPLNDYIIIYDLHKTSYCWTSYSGKYNMKNDWLNLLEVVDYDHKFHGLESDVELHMDTCMYVNLLWLFND